MTTSPLTKINLSDDQRSKIRWASTKAGWVFRAEHFQGPRGGKYRPNLRFAGVTETDALRAVDSYRAGSWKPGVKNIDLYQVDALGNVTDALLGL